MSKVESEKNVDQGFVIYEKGVDWQEFEDETKTEEEKLKALVKLQSKYNQYVWVPVSENELEEIYGVEKTTEKLVGKPYEYNQEGRKALNWSILQDKMNFTNGINIKEPGLYFENVEDIVNEMDLEKMFNMNRQEFNRELCTTFYKTIKSIKKYGGFYIGRYENGYEDEKMVIHRMNEELTMKNWAEVYNDAKKLKQDNGSVYTNLIWGSLWDYTLNWFVNTNEKTYEAIYNSVSWGNYEGATFEYYTDLELNTEQKQSRWNYCKIIPTGSTEYTKVNNIYDMAGNTKELTLESNGKKFNARGGYFEGDERSGAYRSDTRINLKSQYIGSRSMLFLK